MSSFSVDHTLHKSEGYTPTAQNIVVTATFTAEPIADVLDFWLDTLGIAANIEFAPYQQVFQQLLDPDSAIARNRNGFNILLVRWEDWQQRDDQQAALDPADRATAIAEHGRQFVDTLKTVADRSPARFLVCICPHTPTADLPSAALYAELSAYARAELESAGNLWLLSGEQIQARYPVADYYDAHSDALGHIPFTPHFFTALGTSIARTISALLHPPTKVVVLDCDHTLWGGVCGEDGPLGIVLDEPHLALQRFIVALHDAGMLICLCSKNTEEDVIAVFDQRSDMVLKRDHLVASRINWRAKSENLQALATELQLGLDSFIFIDDNPLECAEVQASCPEVVTLQLPADPGQITPFLDHVWAFDRTRVTAEDTRRTAMYQQNLARERARSTALTLEDFLADLQLDIQIAPLTPATLPRVAQLTQRTNQFNLTTIRRSEGEIQAFCQAGGTCWTVEVADRFGDYGLVGVLLFTTDAEAITVDTWLLSCRVLGKRVEHHMLARLGELAQEHGLSRVHLRYTTTAKNQPARDFLESIGGEFKTPTEDGTAFSLPSDVAATTLARRITAPRPATDVVIARQDVLRPTSQPIAAARSRTALMQQIGVELQSVEQIHASIAARRLRSRADLDGAFVAPETETERQLSAIWTDVLGLDRVGRHDSFFALGGQSLLGTRLLSRVRGVFGVELSQVALFETPTLSALAERIDMARREQTGSSAASSIPSLPRQTPATSFPVSFAQQRLWFLEQLQTNSQAYNDWIALQLTGPLNVPVLETGLNTIIQRHETLRTTFPIEGSTVVQRVGPPQPLALTRIDLQDTPAADREAALIQRAQQQLAEPFDLAQGPLFRAALFRLGDASHLLLM
ncbi:MAG TPA: HAD-IIIC family phosphatase, partial [Herpetosiphonaceae bacterium]